MSRESPIEPAGLEAPASSNRTFFIILAVVLVFGLAIVLRPKIAEEFAPKLETLYVAIEKDGGGLATVGRVELEEGQPFTLRAVLQARRRSGDPVYFTDARRLLLGDREIPAGQLEPWPGGAIVKLRWFTVEGTAPYFELQADSGIAAFRMEEFARNDWPLAWSIPGELDPAHDNDLASAAAKLTFGTQRYQVHFETYENERALVPLQSIRSWGMSDLQAEIARFPTVVVGVAGPAAAASRVFGLSQLEPPAEATPELLRQIDDLNRHGVAFSRLRLLRDLVAAGGLLWQDLAWQTLDLGGATPWRTPDEKALAAGGPAAVGPGDLLRVGDRVVVLYRDAGVAGKLDRQDLAFDFERGARLLPLEGIFSGEGEIEHTPLGARRD